MSIPIKGLDNMKVNKPSIQSKVTPLNPNAAEFVPSSLKSTNENNKTDDSKRLKILGTSTEVTLDRSDSTTSNNLDDEVGNFWQHHLPDDITPDFTVTEDSSRPEELSLSGMSIYDDEASRLPTSMSRQLLHDQVSNGLTQKVGFSSSLIPEYQSAAFISSATDSRDSRFIKSDQHRKYDFEGHNFKGSSAAEFVNCQYDDYHIMEDSTINYVKFLAFQFPGFSIDKLADIYYANGCDLNMTIEVLTQLELQVDASFTENNNSNAVIAPSLRIGFPGLKGSDAQSRFIKDSRDNMPKKHNFYSLSSSIIEGDPDFCSAVGNFASPDNVTWKLNRSDPMYPLGSSIRNSQLLNSIYDCQAKVEYENKLQGFGLAQSPPLWLETGEAAANMYSASKREAHEYARLHSACFQQAREAYLIGNKALAKKLGDEGKWYNLQMKEAHAKSREAIYRVRNPFTSEFQDNGRGQGRGQERLINLQGLHVNEALHVLKHELGFLRNAVQYSGHALLVLICVGTGHRTKGTRNPARLPIAIEQYLSEEGILYTQPQPGLLRAIIY